MEQQWHTLNMLTSIGVGAGLMYFLDPVQGRRRALVRDKVVSGLAQSGDLLDKAARDLGHRAWGSVGGAAPAYSGPGAAAGPWRYTRP
jgi:hypothetical protein